MSSEAALGLAATRDSVLGRWWHVQAFRAPAQLSWRWPWAQAPLLGSPALVQSWAHRSKPGGVLTGPACARLQVTELQVTKSTVPADMASEPGSGLRNILCVGVGVGERGCGCG